MKLALNLRIAKHYDPASLSNMRLFETPEMKSLKNQPCAKMVFYDEFEMNSPKVVLTLFQRGYDNVYVLTGGIFKTFD